MQSSSELSGVGVLRSCDITGGSIDGTWVEQLD